MARREPSVAVRVEKSCGRERRHAVGRFVVLAVGESLAGNRWRDAVEGPTCAEAAFGLHV